jgi:quercetin dioxygenase-like cupin family protein
MKFDVSKAGREWFLQPSIRPAAEGGLTRRLFAGGLIGLAPVIAAASIDRVQAAPADVAVSAEGIVRQTLQNHVDEQTGSSFRLVLATFPPGVAAPSHRHPSVGHNFILEGTAESQYEGEELKVFTAGDSYQDKPGARHVIFRNQDLTRPLRYLLAYTVQRDQSFLIVP